MKFQVGMIASFIFSVVMAVGCESVALLPRPDVDDTVNRDRLEPAPEIGRADRAHGEIIGTVERIDNSRREILLRTAGRDVHMFRYDSKTLVYDRERDLRVSDLREGDEIAVQPGGGFNDEQYADVIRIRDRRSDARYVR